VCYGTEKYQWPAKTEGLLHVMVLKSAVPMAGKNRKGATRERQVDI
jgi:hypothetical protein